MYCDRTITILIMFNDKFNDNSWLHKCLSRDMKIKSRNKNQSNKHKK